MGGSLIGCLVGWFVVCVWLVDRFVVCVDVGVCVYVCRCA